MFSYHITYTDSTILKISKFFLSDQIMVFVNKKIQKFEINQV